MTSSITLGFSGGRLDRADHLREDPDSVAALRADPAARLLLLDKLDPQVDADGLLVWGSLDQAPAGADLLLLGLLDGVPHFAALTRFPADAPRSSELWPMIGRMPASDAAHYAAARSLVDWHNRHRFCAQCGNATRSVRAGWSRECNACKAQHYPRNDPVVIMLAEHQGRVLVGRQRQFPPGRYSALAGFLEVGETIEEAVMRELREEAGVTATSVRYIASQPWPFPSSLMIACIAEVSDDRLTLDTKEIEDAMWCDRAGVEAALAEAPGAPFLAPPPLAIAHSLLSHWVRGG